MKEKETLDEANAFVMDLEAKQLNTAVKGYGLAQKKHPTDDRKLNKLLDYICKEKKRLDPKDKFDHEEVFILTGLYTKGKKP